MPPKCRSLVWKFFEKLDKDHVDCKLCNKTFKYHTNTSNMKGHLKSKHRDVDLNDDTEYVPSESTAISTYEGETQPILGLDEEKQVCNFQRLVVPIAMRSVYWKCFGFPAGADGEVITKMKIVCLLCKHVISYNRNTSNLRMHLMNKHPEELQDLEGSATMNPTSPPKKKKYLRPKREGNLYSTELGGSFVLKESGNNTSTASVSMSNMDEYNSSLVEKKGLKNVSNKSSTSTSEKQVTLVVQGSDGENCTIESLHPFMIPMHNNVVSDAVTEFIVTDMQNPDIVEGQGFQRLIAVLRSPCEIPSRTKLVEEVIPKLYDSVKESLHSVLTSIKSEIALTVEEWDSSNGETFVTFSVCYHQEKGDCLHHRVLSTISCPASVEVSYWNLAFSHLLEEYGIGIEKIKAVIYGSCRHEIIEAIERRGLVVIPCLVQTLQDVCTRVCFEQDDVSAIISKCRACICLIYKSTNALAALKLQDQLMALDETPLVGDFPRAWISTYLMLEAILNRRQFLQSILDSLDPNSYDKDLVSLSDPEYGLIEDVLTVLEPFKVTMMTLSEEKSPLLSLLKPLLWQLTCSHLQDKCDDSVNAQLFKAAMKTLLSEKYNDAVVNKLLLTATTLDPRFKSLPTMVDEIKATLEGTVKEELRVLVEQTPIENKYVIEDTPQKKKSKLSGIMMLMGEIAAPTPSTLSYEDRASLEIVQYQSEATAPLDECPLAWWGRTEPKCPTLSRLAGQYLCVPASCLPPSRLNTEAQVSYELRRACLSPEVIDRLIFLKSNYGACT